MKHIYLFLLVLFSTAAFAGSGPFHFTKANRPQHKLRLTKKIKRPKPPRTVKVFKAKMPRKKVKHVRYY